MALLSLLARLGTSQPVEPLASLDELAEGFDFAHFGRAPAHFDLHDVELLNARLLHHLDFAAVADRLPEGASEADWLLLRGNLDHARRLRRLERRCSMARSRRRTCPSTTALFAPRRRCSRRRSIGPTSRGTRSPSAQGSHRPQGPRPVPPAAPRADGPRKRPGNGRPAQAHRPGPCDPAPRGGRAPPSAASTRFEPWNGRDWRQTLPRPILAPCPIFPRPSSPRAAIADLRAYFAHGNRRDHCHRRDAGGAGDDHHPDRVLRRFADQHRAAGGPSNMSTAGRPTAPTPRSSPSRRRTRRRPRPGAKANAGTIPETRENARDVSALATISTSG